nr:hypothetical protein [Tanacetum cinerariifolium]
MDTHDMQHSDGAGRTGSACRIVKIIVRSVEKTKDMILLKRNEDRLTKPRWTSTIKDRQFQILSNVLLLYKNLELRVPISYKDGVGPAAIHNLFERIALSYMTVAMA